MKDAYLGGRYASSFALGILILPVVFLTACGAESVTTADVSTAVRPSIVYDFTKGASLAPRGGWHFADTSWKLDTVPGTSGTVTGLPFRYPGVTPGNYGMTEMRFGMPRGEEFWISLRWHVPANYHHRHDTWLTIPQGERTGWALGDTVVGTDSVSWGVISKLDSNGIYLRFALKSAYNEIWTGKVRNHTRKQIATASGRNQWAANNKLMAVWADGYSSQGTGSSIIWGTDLDWISGEKGSQLAVGYSTGGKNVSGAPASGGVLIRAQDSGKWIDLVFHARFASAAGAKDGVIETWFQRRGEAVWTKAHDIRDADLNRATVGADSLRTWGSGYLMGWSNSGFDSMTTFSISRLEYSYGKPAMLRNTP
ncbi:MAG: hypothetical protein RL318_225 [Fibrobacterota bacterium]|jgi:hypothetical protein